MFAIRFCGCHGCVNRTGEYAGRGNYSKCHKGTFPFLLFVHILQALDAGYAYRSEAVVSGKPPTTNLCVVHSSLDVPPSIEPKIRSHRGRDTTGESLSPGKALALLFEHVSVTCCWTSLDAKHIDRDRCLGSSTKYAYFIQLMTPPPRLKVV